MDIKNRSQTSLLWTGLAGGSGLKAGGNPSLSDLLAL